jgi:BCD family chlorophyll transporter-like MFS transporter
MMNASRTQKDLGWLGIVRLGLVQACLGSIVVMTTSVMNRVMVVELALPAMLPGALVAWHYLIQVLRPRLGHGSDVGGRRTPWIIGGMILLALGGFGASMATMLMGTDLWMGLALAFVSFSAIGLGVGAAGTSLLVLLAKRVAEPRRPAAATIVWLMMFAGFVITAIVTSQLLDPFTPLRLVEVTGGVAIFTVLLTGVAVWGMEGAAGALSLAPAQGNFYDAVREVWAEPHSRSFALFVFVSMLAYSAQELILDPFAGSVFALSPGQSTKLSGVQHGGALVGMIVVAVCSQVLRNTRFASMRSWTMGGCAASAIGALLLAVAGQVGPVWPLHATVFALGIANGSFAVAAIGSMMQMVSRGAGQREGVRMGVWGAAQAVAFGLGGLFATGTSDLARALLPSPSAAYAVVFVAEAALFLGAASLAARVFRLPRPCVDTANSALQDRPTIAATVRG